MLLPECGELDAYRLKRDLTWEALSAVMTKAGFGIPPRTLHYHLTRAPQGSKPYDRTLHKIQGFLAHLRAAERRRGKGNTKRATKAQSASAA